MSKTRSPARAHSQAKDWQTVFQPEVDDAGK